MCVEGLNATLAGSVPLSENDGAGNPVAVRVKDPSVPTVNAVLDALVNAGASFTVKVNVCEALGSTPFCAVNVKT